MEVHFQPNVRQIEIKTISQFDNEFKKSGRKKIQFIQVVNFCQNNDSEESSTIYVAS